MAKKAVAKSTAPLPIEEPVVLIDHPETLPDQSTIKTLAILLVIAKQFQQLLHQFESLATILQALQ